MAITGPRMCIHRLICTSSPGTRRRVGAAPRRAGDSHQANNPEQKRGGHPPRVLLDHSPY
jgi:hypothetical protein